MKGGLVLVLVALASVLGITLVQAPLANGLRAVKQKDEVFALPPPGAMKVLSLGYDAAGADLLWAKLLLEYGTHWSDHMEFHDAPLFIDDILALDPHHRATYQYVDTVLIYQPTTTNKSYGEAGDLRAARRYLERGVVEFPYDGELWLHYGQVLAFLSPAYFTDPKEIDEWRSTGARAMAHALDLGVRADRTSAAAALLGKSGQRDAQIEYLTRAYALTEESEERDFIRKQLEALHASAQDDARARAAHVVETTWRGSFPYLTRGQFLLLSPATNAPACAGRENADRIDCLTSWSEVMRSAGL